MITEHLIRVITGDPAKWYAPMSEILPNFGINTPQRLRMFLAQFAHETQGYTRLVENLRYSAAALMRTWPNRFSSEDAVRMQYDEVRIAERAYGGRMGNRVEGSGDGYKYRGRGLPHVTGANNYRACASALGLPLMEQPELLEEPEAATMSGAWYWSTHGCNELADAGDYAAITRAINGGMNGHSDRVVRLEQIENRWMA